MYFDASLKAHVTSYTTHIYMTNLTLMTVLNRHSVLTRESNR
jgi:hypothetical protein